MSNATEKQTEYAAAISSEWRKVITSEIDQIALRGDSSLAWYSDKLSAALVKFDQAIAQVGAVKIIEMKNSGVNPANFTSKRCGSDAQSTSGASASCVKIARAAPSRHPRGGPWGTVGRRRSSPDAGRVAFLRRCPACRVV